MFANVPDQALVWVFQFMVGCITLLSGVWIKRLQNDVKAAVDKGKESDDKTAKVATAFHEHQLAFLKFQLEHAKEYSTKIEAATNRKEIMDELKNLELKIDGFQKELNKKADR